MSTDAFIEAYEKVKSAEAAAVEPEKVVEPATEEVSAEENKEQDVAAGSSEASGEVAAEDSGPDDLIEFQIGEETKQVPLSELVASYSEKQSAPKDVGLPDEVLQLKESLIQRLDVMEKILSDDSDVRSSLAELDGLMKTAAAEEDWTEVARLQYQHQNIVTQAQQRGEALRKIRQEKEQEVGEYNAAFYQEQRKILEKSAPDLLKDNGLQKVADFVSKHYNVPSDIVAEIRDARFFVMAKDAMAHHDMKMKSSEVLRPVKEAPKVIKRSVGKVTVTDNDIKQSNIRTLRANIRNSSSQAEKNNNLAGLWLEMKK
ncbi:MAG: hypothetical protein ACK54Y_05710 [Bacteroidota bacterium]